MTHAIAEPCIGVKDESCVAVCPVDCIHEGEQHFYIDPDECIDCGACQSECPVGAIFTEDTMPQEWRGYVGVNAELAASRAGG